MFFCHIITITSISISPKPQARKVVHVLSLYNVTTVHAGTTVAVGRSTFSPLSRGRDLSPNVTHSLTVTQHGVRLCSFSNRSQRCILIFFNDTLADDRSLDQDGLSWNRCQACFLLDVFRKWSKGMVMY